MISYKVIGEHIKEARIRKQLTQAEAADMVGISATYYGKIERAIIRPNIDKLADISEAFNVPFESLFQGAFIPSGISQENIPTDTEEFNAFFREIGDLADDQTKRLLMKICSEIVCWGQHIKNGICDE